MTWCLAYATSGQEFTVSAALTARGIEHRCPTVTVKETTTSRRGFPKIETYTRPALNGYLFLFVSGEEWNDLVDRPIKHLKPFTSWLHRADIREMQEFCDRIRQMETLHEYSEGDILEIIRGPFAGTMATFRALAEGESKIRAEAELFGRSVPMTILPQDARKA